jgi:hypothetical protein
MRLTFKRFDGRQVNYVDVIDQETGNKVGLIQSSGSDFYAGGGIYIYLFGNRYKTTVHSYAECQGFVKGVEAVLNHMTSTSDRTAQATAA